MFFQIIFQNIKGQTQEVNYELVDTELNHRWFNKLKAIHKCTPDIYDSNLTFEYIERESLQETYEKFCKRLGILYKDLDLSDQKNLNYLHELYEKNNNNISDDIVYAFHCAIHYAERLINGNKNRQTLDVGWGTKEGPLLSHYNCQKYYSQEKINAGDIYLAWSELGKKPSRYFHDGEPNNQNRFNQLCKPNITHRPKFKIYKESYSYVPFNNDFMQWFKNYKLDWLSKYDLEDWQPHDEQGGVLLAKAKNKHCKDILSQYPTFHSIQIR